MSTNSRNYLVALFGFDHVMRSVADGTWDNASPCEGWTARDVAGHAMAVMSNVAAMAGNGTKIDPFQTPPGAIAGTAPYATWYEIRNRLVATLDTHGTLNTVVDHPHFGPTLDHMVGNMMADALIHTWDIARATGGDDRLDPGLVGVALAALKTRDEALLRAPARYGADQTSDATISDQSRLLAFSGRTEG